MREAPVPEKPPQEEAPKQRESFVSRRRLLRTLGAGAKLAVLDTVLSHIPGAPSLSRKFWEQLETATLGISPETLKKEIEETFQVELVGPSTGMVEVAYTDNQRYPTVEWDGPRLKAFISVLAELPPHLYLPRIVNGQDHKVRFVLINPPFTAVMAAAVGKEQLYKGWCACHSAENQLVVINVEADNQTLPWAGRTRNIFIHEITHSLTTPEIEKFIESVCGPIDLDTTRKLWQTFASELEVTKREVFAPAYFSVIERGDVELDAQGKRYYPKYPEELVFIEDGVAIVKSDWREFGEKYFRQKFEELSNRRRRQEEEGKGVFGWRNGELTPEGKAGYVWLINPEIVGKEEVKPKSGFGGLGSSHIGYGAKNFNEFFSVAAESYVKGRSEFVRTYERFLGKERAEKLYEGMEREIFRGSEY